MNTTTRSAVLLEIVSGLINILVEDASELRACDAKVDYIYSLRNTYQEIAFAKRDLEDI